MTRTWKRLFIAIGVIVYVLIVAMAAVHYSFPYRPAALSAARQAASSGLIKIDFEGPRPGWPLTAGMTQFDLGLVTPQGTMPLFLFERIDFRLDPTSLLSRRARVKFNAKAGEGYIRGIMVYQLNDPRELKLEVTEMDLPGFSLTQAPGQGTITGRLRGVIEVLGKDGVLPVDGSGSLQLGPGRVSDLNYPNLPLAELDFEKLDIDFKLKRGQILVEKLELESAQGVVSVTGRVDDLKKLRLNLTGTATVGPADEPLFKAAFRITGSATKPRVKVTSTEGMLPF